MICVCIYVCNCIYIYVVTEGLVKLKPNDEPTSGSREDWYFPKGHVMYVAGSLFLCAQPSALHGFSDFDGRLGWLLRPCVVSLPTVRRTQDTVQTLWHEEPCKAAPTDLNLDILHKFRLREMRWNFYRHVWSHFMLRSNSAIDEVFSRLAESVVSRVVNLACCETVWNVHSWSK